MTIKELIIKLLDYNPHAEIQVSVKNYPYDFEILYGGSEGVQKETCDHVSFCVESLNDAENIDTSQ